MQDTPPAPDFIYSPSSLQAVSCTSMFSNSTGTLPFPHALETANHLDSDTASDVTLLDSDESPYTVGAPLTRMVDVEYFSMTPSQSSDFGDDDSTVYYVREEDINYIDSPDDLSILNLRLNGGDGEGPEGDPLLRTTSHAYVQSVVDHMATHRSTSLTPKTVLKATPDHPSYPLLVRHLPSVSNSARELAIWRYLNSPAIRRDPWNPSPPALSIAQRELDTSAADRLAHIIDYGADTEESNDEAYVVMDRLWDLQQNPLKSTGDLVDFVRQMFQSLVFLHEHNITQASFGSAGLDSVKMDIGLAPQNAHFSRLDFPVKYYLLDWSKAFRLRTNTRRVTKPLTAADRPSVNTNARGRPKNTVTLSASRPRLQILPKRPTPYFGSLVMRNPHINITLGLSCGRARSDPNVTFVLSSSDTPPDSLLELETPKQPRFLSQPSSPDPLSDPESEDEDESESDGTEGVKIVSPVTRALLFATDLKHFAKILQDVVRSAYHVSEVLSPVLAAMRQANTLSLSAGDALKMFESAVRPLDVAS